MPETEETDDKTSLWGPVKYAIIGFVLYTLWRFLLAPIYYLYKIRRWLETEPDYVDDFEMSGLPPLHFKYEVYLTGDQDAKMEIWKDVVRSPIRITTEYSFSPGAQAMIADRGEDRRHIRQLIELALANAPGTHVYLDRSGDPCDFREVDALKMEYRIYPRARSQHELMDGIVRMGSTIRFIRNRLDDFEQNLQNSR